MGKKHKVSFPTLNIWQACSRFKAMCIDHKEDVWINKREFLFMITKTATYYVFKTEDGAQIKLEKSMEKDKKITRVF